MARPRIRPGAKRSFRSSGGYVSHSPPEYTPLPFAVAAVTIYTAAAVGDVAAVADFLTKNADVRAKGGPFDWEPRSTRRTHDSTAKPKDTRLCKSRGC